MEHLRRKLLYEFYKLLDLAILVCVLAFVMLYFSETPKEFTSSDVLAFFSYKIKLVNVILLTMLVVYGRQFYLLLGCISRSVRLNSDKIFLISGKGSESVQCCDELFL